MFSAHWDSGTEPGSRRWYIHATSTEPLKTAATHMGVSLRLPHRPIEYRDTVIAISAGSWGFAATQSWSAYRAK